MEEERSGSIVGKWGKQVRVSTSLAGVCQSGLLPFLVALNEVHGVKFESLDKIPVQQPAAVTYVSLNHGW